MLNQLNFKKIASVNEVVGLFENDFFFLTTKPQFVSEDELENSLIKVGNLYKVESEGHLIGVAYYVMFNCNYMFYKFRISNRIADEREILGFLRMICSQNHFLSRIETHAYSFEHEEIKLYEKIGMKKEFIKNKDGFTRGEFYDLVVFSSVNKEIENLLEGDLFDE